MSTIPFDTPEAALTRSRELWTAILGRAKYDQDVTEYAFGTDETGIVIAEADEHLDTLLRLDEMTADEVAALVDLYPLWSSASVAYVTGDIVAHSGTLYRIVTPHTSQESWTPDATPALWEPCAPEGVIPEWQQPSGQHDAYQLGAQVTHNGSVWQSTAANNVWEPGVYGWVVV